MKLLGLLSFVFTGALLSNQARAAFTEFECDFRTREGKVVNLDIERPFGGSAQRDAVMSVATDGQTQIYNFFVNLRPWGTNRLLYTGADFNLEIDLWPDSRPQWGRTYRADFRTWSVDDSRNYYNIDCRYTRI